MMEQETSRGDILKELLGGAAPDESAAPGVDDLNQLLYRDPKKLDNSTHKSFRLTAGFDPFRPSALERKEDEYEEEDEDTRSFRLSMRKKTTVYFSKRMHRRLKFAKYQLRKMVTPDLKYKVTMSDIVNNALKIVLHEFETKDDNSVLAKLAVKKYGKA